MSVMTDPKKPKQRGGQKNSAKQPTPTAKVTPPVPAEQTEESPKRNGMQINVWVAPEIYAAMQRFRDSKLPFRPTKTDVVENALSEFLIREGFSPFTDPPPAT
jgi:hypothetical protein